MKHIEHLLRVDVSRHDHSQLTCSPLALNLFYELDSLLDPPTLLMSAPTDTAKLIKQKKVNIIKPSLERVALMSVTPRALNLAHELSV
jgi:hypothetical protein